MTMEGFKQFKKVQCFKEGGTVQRQIANFEKRERKTEEKSDAAQDKKIVKKAFKIHDTQQHEEKTNLAGLKKGGRAKKEVGTVKKYKTGGTVENQYAAKKTDKDIKDIANTKRQKPKMLCGGKSVKKMQMGGMTGPAPAGQPANAPSAATGQMTELEKRRMMEKMARAKKYLSPSQQGELISQDPSAAGLPAVGSPLMRKNGGKVKKCAEGGSLKETDAEKNPGLAKLPTDVRNKMGYMRKGGKAKKMMNGGAC
jgi:hypothetical protein